MCFIEDGLYPLQLEPGRLTSEEPLSRQAMMAGSELNQKWTKKRKRRLIEMLIKFTLWNHSYCLDSVLGKVTIQR